MAIECLDLVHALGHLREESWEVVEGNWIAVPGYPCSGRVQRLYSRRSVGSSRVLCSVEGLRAGRRTFSESGSWTKRAVADLYEDFGLLGSCDYHFFDRGEL